MICLGPTGRNFAAGMSGGIAYILDEDARFSSKLNPAMVELEALEEADLKLVRSLLSRHVQYTGSPKGKRVLDAWEEMLAHFIKVMPVDYKRVLLEQAEEQKEIA